MKKTLLLIIFTLVLIPSSWASHGKYVRSKVCYYEPFYGYQCSHKHHNQYHKPYYKFRKHVRKHQHAHGYCHKCNKVCGIKRHERYYDGYSHSSHKRYDHGHYSEETRRSTHHDDYDFHATIGHDYGDGYFKISVRK